MNRIYRVLWNAAKHCYVAANEKTGTAQARGKTAVAAAVAAAVMSGAAAAADAVITQEGELTADKDTVVFYTELSNAGMLPYIDLNPADVSKGPASASAVSKIAENIKNVYVMDDQMLSIAGSGLNMTNTTLQALLGQSSNSGLIQIGSAGEKTTGSFGEIVLGWGTIMPVSSAETMLNIENADVTISKLKVAGEHWDIIHAGVPATAVVNQGATVKVATLTFEQGSLWNHGTLTANKLESEKNETDGRYKYFEGYFINDGTASVANAEAAHLAIRNLESGTLTIDNNLVLNGGLRDSVENSITYGSLNAGKTTVGGKFTLDGFNTWGTGQYGGAPEIGILTNTGTFTVAGDASLKGQLVNTGKDAKFEVKGSVLIDDVVETEDAQLSAEHNGRGYDVHHVWNEEDASFTVGNELTISDDGILDNAGSLTVEQTMTVNAGGTLNNTGMIEAGKLIWTTGEASAGNAGTIKSASVTINADDAESGFANTGTIDFTNGSMTASNVVNEGSLIGGTFTIADGQTFSQNSGKFTTDSVTGSGSFVVNGGTIAVGTFTGGVLTEGTGFTSAEISIDNLAAAEVSLSKTQASIGQIAETASGQYAFGTVTLGRGTLTSDVGLSSDSLTLEESLVANGGKLDLGTMTFADGASLVVGNNSTAEIDAFAGRGEVTVSNLGRLTIGSSESTAGMTFNFTQGGGIIKFADQGWYHNATLNYVDGGSIVLEDGASLGENTVKLSQGSSVEGKIDNVTTYVIGENGTINASGIEFSAENGGSLTLAGGTLVTTLGQIFGSVQASGYIEGVDVSTGESVQIPMSGIQSVGAVKTELTGENGIKYESGKFEFTDDGWTVNAVNSAADQLHAAFDKFSQSESTLVFSGEQDAAGGTFGIADANELPENTVLSSTVLDAAGAKEQGKLTFGDSGDVTNKVIGFESVANASEVAVTGDHHLYLVGSESGTAHVDEVRVEDEATLTLGLNGKNTSGSFNKISLTGGSLEVVSDGTFVISELSLRGNADALISAASTVEASSVYVSGDSAFTVAGTLAVTGEKNSLDVDGKLVNTGTVTGADAGFVNLDNSGVLDVQTTIDAGTVVNSGTVKAGTDLSVGDKLVNSGLMQANSAAFRRGFVNEAAGEITADEGSVALSELKGENTNAGSITAAAGVSISLNDGAQFTNSGVITTGDEGLKIQGGEDVSLDNRAKFVNSGKLQASSVTASNVAFENSAAVSTDQATFTNAAVTLAEGGSITADTLAATGSTIINNGSLQATDTFTLTGGTLTNNGKLAAEELKLAEDASVANNGSLSLTNLTLGAGSAVDQGEDGIVEVENLTVTGNSFNLDAGTWVIGSESGIKFVTEDGEAVADGIVMNITSGREFVTDDASVDGTTYNVSKTLAFGASSAGLAAKIAGQDEAVKNAEGILVVGKAITIGEGGSINLGAAGTTGATEAARISLLADPAEEGGTAGGETTAAGFRAAANTVTIFTGDVFGEDGTAAAITGNNTSAVIEKGALARLTNVAHEGSFTLIKDFDFSANLDEQKNWIGGWAGDDVDYVVVDDGSDLDWIIDVAYDAEKNALVADATMADVRTKYDFAIADIANAALRNDVEGADVDFLRAVIRNDQLDVAQTEKIVNSVSQIAASLGTAANVLSDASSLMDAVEGRTGFIGEAGKGAGLWVQLEGGKYKTDGLELAGGLDAGYDADTYGFTFGADAMVRPDLRVGAAFSYLKGDADAEGDVLCGTSDYDTFGLQAYAAWDLNDTVRLSGEIGWFRSSADLEQTISFANVRKATADVDTNAATFGIRVEGKFNLGQVAVVPHAGLRGLWLMNDDFDTKIDGAKAFKNEQDDTFTMQLPIGVAFEKSFSTASGWTVTPAADFTVTPQFGDTDYETTVTGIGTGVSQGVNADMAGNVTGRMLLGVKAGTQNVEIGAHYGFTAGDAGRQDHSFGVNFAYRF